MVGINFNLVCWLHPFITKAIDQITFDENVRNGIFFSLLIVAFHWNLTIFVLFFNVKYALACFVSRMARNNLHHHFYFSNGLPKINITEMVFNLLINFSPQIAVSVELMEFLFFFNQQSPREHGRWGFDVMIKI